MDLLTILKHKTRDGFQELFGFTPEPSQLEFQQTRKPYEGDLTLVVFPFVRFTRKSPEETAGMIGEYLTTHLDEVTGFNVAKGFLNFSIADQYWLQLFEEIFSTENFGLIPETADSELVMVEYSSPNTNKPLHLGHIRNNLLGYSLSRILKGNGKKVVMTNIVNDRGIHICKSMYAWLQRGNGETPESSGIKGDHLVGKYYVKFDEQYKEEIKSLIAKGLTQEEAEKQAPAMLAVREMLRKWEAHDPETISLWKMMNSWVYNGFDITYRNLGVSFDKIYYESDTYLHGKEEVLRGVKEGTFQQMEDGSVWADLTGEGLDRKVLLRSDGTSVYMTQDIGTAQMRFKDFPIDKMVYVVGNEQNYHFQVLSILLDKLGYKWGKDLYHFSYGMVELPSGKMKSREGTVVDADDLMEDMFQVARKMGEELGKLEGLSAEEADKTYRIIALGALKYFILKVDPKKNMMFNPEESIDFNGNTGPFIQYTHARICSVLRKAAEAGITVSGEFSGDISLNDKEKELIKTISQFPEAVREAGRLYSPALLANYCYDLVKLFNQFYHDHSILNEADLLHRDLRLALSATLIQVLKNGMGMLGIELPERM